MAHLILLRHGKSQWNDENRFTGWVDVPLNENGRMEAKAAGEKLREFLDGKAVAVDKVYTTTLQRASRTFEICWKAMGDPRYPLYTYLNGRMKDWAHFTDLKHDHIEAVVTENFNERYYGDLQGLNKAESAETFGAELVHKWRRSYEERPPNGESLKDTLERTLPTYSALVEEDLRAGKNLLIVAHGNSLRAITKHLEGISDEDIPALEIPTGVPIVYEMDEGLKILEKSVLK